LKRRALLLLALLCAALAVVLLLPVREMLAAALAWSDANREIAWLAFIILYVIATVCFVPATPLTLAAGAIFGLGTGAVLVSAGSTLGATAAFFVGRTIARDWVSARIAAWPKFRALDRAVAARGFWIVLLTRLSPAFPFFLVNYAFGLTAVKPREYVLGSWLGMMPATVAYVYAGTLAASVSQALTGKAQVGASGWVLLGVGLVATVAVTVLVTRVASGYLAREIAAQDAP
jgi:uncharacterized membrane protein YdjX (TVP38/TMEM64 family)